MIFDSLLLSREHKCRYSGFVKIVSFILYDLLFLQPEVYSVHFLVWKGFYICYNFLY